MLIDSTSSSGAKLQNIVFFYDVYFWLFSRSPNRELQLIARCFFSVFNANLLAAMLCGFFSVKRKLFRLSSAFQQFGLVPVLPVPHRRFPLQRSEAAEDVPGRVQNHSQSVCVPVTSAVKFFCFETIATAPATEAKTYGTLQRSPKSPK
jgi:hypothetical protein